ncbi:hypothetical protein [Ulvibacterium sp.]|uniref:hypothetical protein n=1 Tax=Ulvibacterium sp. TaxID=2665914 RepID=UPI003BAAE6CD
MKTRILFISIALLTSVRGTCQEQFSRLPGVSTTENFMRNPSMFSFNDYSNQELVDLYTGMIDVAIPIYEIKEKDLKVPISIRYHEPGIKVNEDAGWVGLGWNLVAGGQIIREVRGNPDELIMATNPTNGNVYIENLGRFHDLIDITNHNEEFPLGNNNGIKVMDDYVQLLKDNALIDCSTSRFPVAEEPDCELACQYALVNAITQIPFAIENHGQPGANTIVFWNRFRDTQPDIFHYSVPGASGSFVLDKAGQPTPINGATDVSIKPGIGPLATTDEWEIITSNGVVHKFPNNSSYTEISKKSTIQPVWALGFLGYQDKNLSKEDFKAIPDLLDEDYNPLQSIPRVENKVVNTWYLHKISSAGYNSEITFDYQSQANIEQYYFVEERLDYVVTKSKTYNELSYGFECSQEENVHTINSNQYFDDYYLYGNEGCCHTSPEIHSRKDQSSFFPVLQTVVNPKSLNQIFFANGTVEFVLDTQLRPDMPGNYALKNIVLKNNALETMKNFEFDYSIFLELPYVSVSESSRLKLVGLEEKSTSANNPKKYQFKYEETKLPGQFSNSQDYWGFYNNNTQNTLIPNSNRLGVSFTGADRSPDEDKMKAAILKKVIYPTGGSNEFFYEINKYRDKSYNLESPIGGLRVYKTITHDGQSTSNDIIKEYTYGNTGFSSGRTAQFIDRNWWRFFQNDSYYSEYRTNNTLLEHLFLKRSSQPIYDFELTKGSLVGYSSVTVSQNGNGKILYSFTNSENYPDGEGNKIQYPYRGQNGSDLYHDNSHVSKDALRGLLLETTEFREDGTLAKKEKNLYELNPPNHTQILINSLKVEKKYASDFHLGTTSNTFPFDAAGASHYLMDFGGVESYFPFVFRRIVSDYKNDGSISLTKTFEYEKNGDNHMKLTAHEFVNSSDKIEKTKYYYSVDGYPTGNSVTLDELNAIEKLVEQNRIEPIFIETYNNNSRTFRSKNTYKSEFNNLVKLKSNFYSKGGHDFSNKFDFSYDGKGNLSVVSKIDGPHTYYIWGYQQEYPIAKLENFTSTEASGIQTIIDAAVNASNADTNDVNEDLLRNALDNLRNAAAGALVTTYTYDPLIGVTSITDPRGYTIYYIYDDFNRLKEVRDQDNNLVTDYEYHYQGTPQN